MLGATAPGADTNDKALVRVTASGSLDATFGVGGEATIAFRARRDEVRTLLVQPDGKVLTAGASSGVGVIARYQRNGDLDPDFADGGIRIAGPPIEAVSLAIDGTILVANELGAEALTPQGVTFSWFGGDAGLPDIAPWPGAWLVPRGVSVDDYGRVTLGGFAGGDGTTRAVVLRLLGTGERDPTFGPNGVYVGTATNEKVFASVVDSNFRALIVGLVGDTASGGQRPVVTRVTALGVPDSLFAGDDGKAAGHVTLPSEARYAAARAIAVQRDGRAVVLVTGGDLPFVDVTDTTTASTTTVVRLTVDGRLDGTFGTGGVAKGGALDGFVGRSLALAPDGSVALGGTRSGDAGGLAVVRLTKTGVVDESTGDGGLFAPDLGAPAQGWAIATSADGRAIVVGFLTRSPTGRDFALLTP